MAYYKNVDNLVLLQDGYPLSKIDTKKKTIFIRLECYYDIEYRNKIIVDKTIEISQKNPLKYKVIITISKISKTVLKSVEQIDKRIKDIKNIKIDIDVKKEKIKINKKISEKRKFNYFKNKIINESKTPKKIPENLCLSLYGFSEFIANINDEKYFLKIIKNIKNIPRIYRYYWNKTTIENNLKKGIKFKNEKSLNFILKLCEKSELHETKKEIEDMKKYTKLFDQ